MPYPASTSERWNAGVITSMAVVLGTVAIVGIDQFSLGVSNGFAPLSMEHPAREGARSEITDAPPVSRPKSLPSDPIPSQEQVAADTRAAPDALRAAPETPPLRLDAGRIAAQSPIRTADFVVPGNSALAPPRSGKLIYQESCASCHDSGRMNSPSVHDLDAWTDRLARGKHSLYASVTAGKGAVKRPAHGRALPDDELVAATDYLTERLIDLSVARASRAGFSIAYGPGGTLPVSAGGEPRREATLKSD